MAKREEVAIENADIAFRNFEGKEGTYNRAGDRNFCLILDDKLAEDLAKRGYNVKYLKPREEGDKEQPYLSIAVSFKNTPPNIYLVSSRGKNRLSEDDVKILDWAEIETADVIFVPYDWEVNGKSGRKAYLKTLYVVIAEDEFEKKYSDVKDGAQTLVGGCGNCEACDGSCHAEE